MICEILQDFRGARVPSAFRAASVCAHRGWLAPGPVPIVRHAARRACPPVSCRFLRRSGSFGISASLAARGPEPLHGTVLGLGFAGQRSVNHCVLTLCSAGPWDRGNPCRRRPSGRGWAGVKGHGPSGAGRASVGRGSGMSCAPQRSDSSDGIRAETFLPVMRRGDAFLRHPTHSCVGMRREPGPREPNAARKSVRTQWRPPTRADRTRDMSGL
jgi:hypothetical protein